MFPSVFPPTGLAAQYVRLNPTVEQRIVYNFRDALLGNFMLEIFSFQRIYKNIELESKLALLQNPLRILAPETNSTG